MAKMLINNEKTLKSLLGGIQKFTTWATWMPFVRQAELDHIIPAIGEDLYDYLCDKIDSNDAFVGSDRESRLLEKVRVALGHFTSMDSELSILLQKGDAGIAVASPPNMQAPGKWAIVARIKEARDKADRSIEQCLQYMEKHADEFPAWTSSEAYTLDRSLVLTSATQYTQYLGVVQNSRRLYQSLRPYIRQSEKRALEPLLGIAFYQDVKGKLANEVTLTDLEADIVEQIRTIVAYDAWARSLTYLNINADMRLVSETDGINNEDVLPKERRGEMKAEAEKTVDADRAKLKKLLDTKASPTVLTAYYNSAAYTPSVRKAYQLPANDDPQLPFVL